MITILSLPEDIERVSILWKEMLTQLDNGVIASQNGQTSGEVKCESELLEELDRLIGLTAVKEDLHSLINIIKLNEHRRKRNLSPIPTTKHLVFSGNPGTGKTTVARILAKIYNKLGILSKGHLVEVDRSGLVSQFLGATATKTMNAIQKAMGGILFIDEAYALTVGKHNSDYGSEAVDTLLKAMEDNRDDLVVIVAGYPDLMEQFLESNPGLRSRFNKFIQFEDYSPEEMLSIFLLLCKNHEYQIGAGVKEKLLRTFNQRCLCKGKNFANGREVRNLFEQSVGNQANRLGKKNNPTDEELLTLQVEDIADMKEGV